MRDFLLFMAEQEGFGTRRLDSHVLLIRRRGVELVIRSLPPALWNHLHRLRQGHMKIKIVGAAGGEVTGSAYFVQTGARQSIATAGMFQGGKSQKRRIASGWGQSPKSMQFC